MKKPVASSIEIVAPDVKLKIELGTVKNRVTRWYKHETAPNLDFRLLWFCLQNDKFCLKMEIMKFVGIQPTIRIIMVKIILFESDSKCTNVQVSYYCILLAVVW